MFAEDTDTMIITTTRPWTTQDRVREAVALVDAQGTICYLNPDWKNMIGTASPYCEAFHVGDNYLGLIDAVFDPGSTYVHELARGLRLILQGRIEHIELEFPCAEQGRWHWFQVQMHAHNVHGTPGVLIQHYDMDELRVNGTSM
jgi:hypothetical protein